MSGLDQAIINACVQSIRKLGMAADPDAFREALAAAGYAVVPDRGDGVWFLNAADPEYGHNNLCEMLDDSREILVEVQHATIVRRTWHVRLDDEENGCEWREFASETEARAMLAAAGETKE